MTGDFLYFVALVVLLIDDTGSAGWVAAASVARILVYVVLGPFGGAVADRYDRRRLMVILDVGRFITMSVVAVVIWADVHVVVVIALTVVNSVLTVPYRSAAVAATPHVVSEDDLAAANAAESVIAQFAFFVGPAIGALVVAATDAGFAFLINGFTFLVSALLVLRAGDLGGGRKRPTTDNSAAESMEEAIDEQASSMWADVVDGGREVRGSRGLLALMVVTSALLFQVGAERVLHVLVAQDVLGRGADWVGVMAAAMGVGGLLVAPFAARMGASRFSGALLAISGVLVGVPFMLLGVTHSAAVVLVLLGVQGVGGMIFEVTFITLLQRWTSEAAIARVFGLNDSLTAVTEIVGATLAPVLVAVAGLNSALVVVGAILVAGSVGVAPLMHRESQRSNRERLALAPIIEQLRGLGIFEDASNAALERIAASLRPVSIAAGTAVFAEGDTADDLYIVRSGQFEAESAAGGRLSVMGLGEWFGEIGVMRRMPRTATVRALSDSTAWAIDGQTFTGALAGPLQAQGLLHGTMTTRLARTHPQLVS
jgi:MFS family permease